ncbi:hypothetical protein V8J88_11080 [Massilia sp. W12]|uniref:hypothetical protein n=1 Tax=Massilia sp. W12 TaxID=3126507 RepID=UPI0030D3ED0B
MSEAAADEAFWALAHALMAELADGRAQSAARLCKRLGVRMSTLQRALAALGQGGADCPGLDWIAQRQDGERLLLQLTDSGAQAWRQQQEGAL